MMKPDGSKVSGEYGMGNGECGIGITERWLLSDSKRIRLLARFAESRQDFGSHSEYAFMATQWFYAEGGEQRGPVGFEELKARADQGLLRPDDFVWGEGMPQWKLATQVEGIFESPPTAPPPLPGQSTDGPPHESWDTGYRDTPTATASPDSVDSDSRMWAMFLHLSQLLHFIPLAGFIIPIVIWQVKKDELPWLDQHGKNVVNWMISEIIYFVASFFLMIVLVGIPLLVAMGICAIVFPIIGGIKASSGVVWKYPMVISFLK